MRRVMDSEPIDVVVSGSSAEMLSSEIASNLHGGGFPEVQGLEERSRRLLLGSYVDSTVLRDVIERHAVCEHLAELVLHLESAFLIQRVSVAGGSLRRQMTLPRKVYPIDPGLLPLYESEGVSNRGHALGTAVLLELRRRGADVDYLRTSGGFEVDFLARFPDGQRILIQVCADLSEPATRHRELRALVEALEEPGAREARAIVISLDRLAPKSEWPEMITWSHAAEWLLEG